jgi:hypothetical protein
MTHDGRDLEGRLLALARRATTKRHRAFLILWWVSQIHLLTLPLAKAVRKALDRELAEEAGSRSGKISPPLWCLPTAAMILGMAGSALWAGGLDTLGALTFLRRKDIIGYSPNGADASTEFRAIPGAGGGLPDGLLIDTTRTRPGAACATVRIPLALFEHERLVPFGAKALRVQLDWRIVEGCPHAAGLPALKLSGTEMGPVDPEGHQELVTFSTRNLFLGEGGKLEGRLEPAIHTHPPRRALEGSKDVLFGPLLFIPPGWKIEIRNLQVTALDSSLVPSPPPGEMERFVAWYRQHQRGPTAVDLAWKEFKE